MPTRWSTFLIECREGLITNLPPLQQGLKVPGSAARLINFEPSVQGGYRRINGFTKWDTNVVPSVTSTNIILGVGFLDGDVVAVREDKIFTSSGTGWTQIASGRTHSGKHRFQLFNFDGTKKILGVDSTDWPYTWDGSTFTEITGTADVNGASHAVEFKDHIFYSKGSLVTFSAPFDETDFTVANGSGSFRMPNDVTGMFVFRQRLFVFTEREIKVLDGSSVSDFTLTSVSRDVGCAHEDTIQEVGGDVLFLSKDGVRLLGATDRIGDFQNAVVSKNVQSEMTSFHNFYTEYSSVVINEKSQYRLMGYLEGRDESLTNGFIATQLSPEATPESFAWSETLGIKAYSAVNETFNNTEYTLFSNGDGYVYQLDDGSTFDGEEILADYWTPYLSFEDPSFRKTLYRVTSHFSPEGDIDGTLTLNYNQNDKNKIQPQSITLSASGGGAVYGTAVYGTDIYADAPEAVLKKTVVGAGFNVSLQYTFRGGSPFIIDTITVEYTNEGRT